MFGWIDCLITIFHICIFIITVQLDCTKIASLIVAGYSLIYKCMGYQNYSRKINVRLL